MFCKIIVFQIGLKGLVDVQGLNSNSHTSDESILRWLGGGSPKSESQYTKSPTEGHVYPRKVSHSACKMLTVHERELVVAVAPWCPF